MKHDEFGLPANQKTPVVRRMTKLRTTDSLQYAKRSGVVSWPLAFKALGVGQSHTVTEVFSHDNYSPAEEAKFFRRQSEALRKGKQRAAQTDPTVRLRRYVTYRTKVVNPDRTISLSMTLTRKG